MDKNSNESLEWIGIASDINEMVNIIVDSHDLNVNQMNCANVLISLKEHLQNKSLHIWEESVNEALSKLEDKDSLSNLLNEIADHGKLNLYCAFNEKLTRKNKVSVIADIRNTIGMRRGPTSRCTGDRVV